MKRTFLLISLIVVPSTILLAQSINSWIDSNGKWEAGANWSAGSPSISQSLLLITNANSKTVTIDGITSGIFSGTMTISNLMLFAPLGSTNTLSLENAGASAPLQVLNNIIIDADGAVIVNNSAVQATNAQFDVGYTGATASLIVTNGGVICSGFSCLAFNSSSSNNSALVAGNGSIWSNSNSLSVGGSGSGNRLTITSGGQVENTYACIGCNTSATANTVLVTGVGSVWNNYQGDLYVGDFGAGNNLVISNGGVVVNSYGIIGLDSSGSNNTVLVTSGGAWSNRTDLDIGRNGASNRLIVTNGGTVFCGSAQLGYFGSSSGNLAVVGSGGLWNNVFLTVGRDGAANQLIVTNGGTVLSSSSGFLGWDASGNNNVVVITSGGIWSVIYEFEVGVLGAANQLIVTDGGMVHDNDGYLGFYNSSRNNSARVSNNGIWQSDSSLHLGYFAGGGNILTIDGGSVIASNANIGTSAPSSYGVSRDNVIRVDSGSLIVTNAVGDGALVVSRAGGPNSLILNGGVVTVDLFIAADGVNSIVVFNGGTLQAKGTAVTNSQQFIVGDGSSAATFHLLGGVHSFNDGIRVRNNATVSGCGTINGTVLVDAGGTVLADCSGRLTFTGIVTNNGTMRAINGSVLEAYGAVVNNGTIDITGGTTNFHGIFINNGTIIGGPVPLPFQITSIALTNVNDLLITWNTSGATNMVQVSPGAGASGSYWTNSFADLTNIVVTTVTTNFWDVGAATNGSARYYRIRLPQ